jgi:hypothetical protein
VTDGHHAVPIGHLNFCYENPLMWKILVGFVIFAALALYVLTKSGGDIDLGGEKHDVGAGAHDAPAASAAAPASAASR